MDLATIVLSLGMLGGTGAASNDCKYTTTAPHLVSIEMPPKTPVVDLATPLLLAAAWSFTASAGIVGSSGLGERGPSPSTSISYERPAVRVVARFEPVAKIELGRGWVASGHVEVGRSAIAGVGYVYRDGGDWHKHSVWLLAGYTAAGCRVILSSDLNSVNRVGRAELSYALTRGHLILEPLLGIVRYDEGAGWGVLARVELGWRLARTR